MGYRKLGSGGTLVSTLALGTMNFGTPQTPEEGHRPCGHRHQGPDQDRRRRQ
jgi:aryl-alcohol dehydrogenase-like predicted oxidoreductase